jgi:hypothetical protein
MGPEDRKGWIRGHITEWVSAKKIDDALSAAELGNLSHTQKIPAALAEINPNPVWFVEALTATPKSRMFGNVDDAIAAATNQSSPIDRSSGIDRYQSSGIDSDQSSSG